MEKPLISVLVVCYNNQKHIYECLQSIFSQTYPNIEVLIGDDCSDNFDGHELITWINQNRTENISKIVVVRNEQNLGTVANLENLQQRSQGEYLFNIAADDAMFNEAVLDCLFAKAVENGSSAELVVAETEMWDQSLERFIGPFITPGFPDILEQSSPRTLFAACAYRILLPASYLYRRSVLEKVGKLSDKYRLIEDVPTHLRLLAQGIKPLFLRDLPAIKHRDGGISHGNKRQSKLAFLFYQNDMLSIYPNEIEPHLDMLTPEEQRLLKKAHDDRIRYYHKSLIPSYYIYIANLFNGEAIRALKDAERAGRLPPSENPPIRRNRIEHILFLISRKDKVLLSAFLAVLCLFLFDRLQPAAVGNIASLCTTLHFAVMLFSICTAVLIVINICFRIQFYLGHRG